ncbi:MAG: hypothetical protein MJ142_05965 [Clostridia bacterium]|nr:hypothetical protein [Clostridia bacterium]
MRKCAVIILLILTIGLFACASADTAYSFEDIFSTVSLSDNYIVLTPDNLSAHTEWLEKKDLDQEALLADWAERGVLLQAWTQEGDACAEISALQDEDAAKYFDVDQQTTQMRTSYRLTYAKGDAFKALGYKASVCEWKKTKAGRFLQIKYSRSYNGESYKGYMRRTIRNGWSIVIDYRVYDRATVRKDQTNADNIMNAWVFSKTEKMPEATVGDLIFTSEPPAETISGKFSVEGTCYPGAVLTGVAMRMSSNDIVRVEETADKKGRFKMNVSLPAQGIWLLTVTVENNGTEIAYKVFETTNYSSTLLPVNWTSPVPDQLYSDQTVISGKTTTHVTVQCIVEGPSVNYTKQIKTNNKGTFSFKVPTANEGDYKVTVVLSKKKFDTRRFTYTANRTLTVEDKKDRIRDEAVKPAYNTLKSKVTGYTGKYMVYNAYITDIEVSGEETIIFAALKSSAKKGYSQKIVIVCDEEPNFKIDSQHKFYGKCTGTYQVQSEDSTELLPCFDLMFWEN